MEIDFVNINFFLGKENLCPAFRAFPVCDSSQWPSAQKNPHTKETYFGVAFSGTTEYTDEMYTSLNF